ncbi:MAG: helix-turn-helix domain-containing protein [Saprospiraceae bacterium]
MISELSILNILILFGAFQGLILTFILITSKRFQKKSNYFLALLLFSLALLNLVSIMELKPSGVAMSLFSIYHPFFLVNLIAPAAYFFIKYLTEPIYRWKLSDYLFFVPFLIEFSIRLYKFSFYASGDLLSEPSLVTHNLWENSIELFGVFFTIAVILRSIKALKKYEEKLLENYSEVETHSLSWLRNILITGLSLCTLWLFVTLSDYSIATFSWKLSLMTLIGLSMLIYWIGYSMIIRQELLDTPIFAISNTKILPPSETSELSSKTEQYYTRLKELMISEKLYQDDNLNMTTLSKKTGLSNSYLSQIINQKEGKNFFDFVNEYRIDEVKARMKDRDYNHYTILGIAQNAGFKSKSTFNSFFKKSTGLTPSEYRKN